MVITFSACLPCVRIQKKKYSRQSQEIHFMVLALLLSLLVISVHGTGNSLPWTNRKTRQGGPSGKCSLAMSERASEGSGGRGLEGGSHALEREHDQQPVKLGRNFPSRSSGPRRKPSNEKPWVPEGSWELTGETLTQTSQDTQVCGRWAILPAIQDREPKQKSRLWTGWRQGQGNQQTGEEPYCQGPWSNELLLPLYESVN